MACRLDWTIYLGHADVAEVTGMGAWPLSPGR
jgi:hypothetical protein